MAMACTEIGSEIVGASEIRSMSPAAIRDERVHVGRRRMRRACMQGPSVRRRWRWPCEGGPPSQPSSARHTYYGYTYYWSPSQPSSVASS